MLKNVANLHLWLYHGLFAPSVGHMLSHLTLVTLSLNIFSFESNVDPVQLASREANSLDLTKRLSNFFHAQFS